MGIRKTRNMRLMRSSQACKLGLQSRYSLILCRDSAFEFLYLLAVCGRGTASSDRGELLTISVLYAMYQDCNRQNNIKLTKRKVRLCIGSSRTFTCTI
jgi:hypothetical protein